MQNRMRRVLGAWHPVVSLLLVVSVVGCAGPSHRHIATLEPRVVDAIRAIGERAVDDDGIVGLSIGVAKNGHLVFADGFGHIDATRNRAADRDTVYDVASIGKHFTAAAVLRLVEEGRLSLDQRVRSLVPELPDSFPDATLDQLLRHTSGFVAGELDEANPPADYRSKRYGLELLTDAELQGGETRYRPGETWIYCNPGYLILGIVVEVVTGRRYDDFVRDELLRPNGLSEVFVCERAEPERMSQSIHRSDDGVAPVPFIDMTAFSGQGSICSSVVDLLGWSRALNAGRVIELESLRSLRTPSTVRGDSAEAEVPYGMAQRLGVLEGHPKVGHTGTFTGGSAALFYYPDDGLEIAVLSNTYGSGTPHAHTIETQIAALMLDITMPDVETLRQPLGSDLARGIAGKYSEGEHVFEATFEAEELVVTREGKELERLVHVGDGIFRDPAKPIVFEWFPLDGERAGWWIYTLSGNYLEVLRRLDTP